MCIKNTTIKNAPFYGVNSNDERIFKIKNVAKRYFFKTHLFSFSSDPNEE